MTKLTLAEEIGTRADKEKVAFTIAPRPGIQVYSNPFGMIVIKNFDDSNREDDEMNYTLIHPDEAKKVAKWILETARQLKASEQDR